MQVLDGKRYLRNLTKLRCARAIDEGIYEWGTGISVDTQERLISQFGYNVKGIEPGYLSLCVRYRISSVAVPRGYGSA